MRIVSDIDGTLLFTHIDDGKYIVDGKNDCVIDKLNIRYDEGNIVILQTGRHWNHLEDTLNQVREAGIKHHVLVMGNPPADVYINDKGIRPYEL